MLYTRKGETEILLSRPTIITPCVADFTAVEELFCSGMNDAKSGSCLLNSLVISNNFMAYFFNHNGRKFLTSSFLRVWHKSLDFAVCLRQVFLRLK